MSDHSELKKYAEIALSSHENSSLAKSLRVTSFYSRATPGVVLALIAEIEGLRAQHGRDSAELRSLSQARDDARKERDQLKADNEELRKDAERYRWLMSDAVMNGTLGIFGGWIDFEFKDEASKQIDEAMQEVKP